MKTYNQIDELTIQESNPRNAIEDDTAEKFYELGYIKLKFLFNKKLFKELKSEVESLAPSRIIKNFSMPGYNTPRIISVLGGDIITEKSKLLTSLYKNKQLIDTVSKIVKKPIYPIDHPKESIVVNYLEHNGGTHGWHLDDPKFALVVIIHSPDCNESGGHLELIPGYNSLAKKHRLHPITDSNKLVEIANDHGLIRKINHLSGECYLLNAAENLHRVAPIQNSSCRTAINFAFDDRDNVTYGKTADLLYSNLDSIQQSNS